jgi:hypothetical protein
MQLKEKIDYWLELASDDLGTFSDIEVVRAQMYDLDNAGLLQFFEVADTGVFAFIEAPDLRGGKSLTEIFLYIKPKHRGDIRLLKHYITAFEELAIAKGCNSVKIGANIDYKDQSLIKVLKRWGYVDDTVSKTFT